MGGIFISELSQNLIYYIGVDNGVDKLKINKKTAGRKYRDPQYDLLVLVETSGIEPLTS